MDVAQIELLQRSKRRTVLALRSIAVGLLVLLALRFVPRPNDALSGKPEYIRILTETFGRQLAAQTQMQFPQCHADFSTALPTIAAGLTSIITL